MVVAIMMVLVKMLAAEVQGDSRIVPAAVAAVALWSPAQMDGGRGM